MTNALYYETMALAYDLKALSHRCELHARNIAGFGKKDIIEREMLSVLDLAYEMREEAKRARGICR